MAQRMKIIFSSANEAVIHDKWVPVTNAWRVLWLWTKERPRIRTVAANISTKRPHKPKRGGPPACELGELLTTPHRENWPCYERIHAPRAWNDPLVPPRQWKRDKRFGIWNVRSG